MPRIPSRRLKEAKEESYTPLLLALAASDSEYLIRTVELLCQFGADVNCSSDLMVRDTPLHFAAALGNDEIIELLFRHIRYVSKEQPHRNSQNLTGSLRSIFKRLQFDTEHSTDQRFLNSQLRTAVSAGAEPVEIRNLLLRGAEVNCIDSLGYTPLLLALVASDSEYFITTVELLCQFGADVNYSSDLLFRDTPLHFAAALGNDEIIELLFRHKADVHARNHAGYTPLHVAAHNGSEASVTALFLCGADLNCTENYCWYTPLHLAVIGQFETVVKALVSSGARINQADSSNLTPLNRCQSKSIRSILLGALNPGCSSLQSSCLAVIRGAVRKVIGIYGFDKLPLPIGLRRKLRLKS